MGETIQPIDVALEEFTPEELKSRHLDILRFFMLPPSGCKDRIPLACLKGRALDISNKNDAGKEALKDLGVRRVREICLPITQLYYVEEERQRNKKELLERLGQIPDNIIGLVTIFDHDDCFIATEVAREIERILAPGGQCLVTCRKESLAPQNDEDLPDIDKTRISLLWRSIILDAHLRGIPDLLHPSWYSMGDKYAPNRLVGIYTKPGDNSEVDEGFLLEQS